MFTILVIGYIALLLGGGRDREEDDDIFMEDSASPASALYNDLYGDIQQQPPNKRGGNEYGTKHSVACSLWKSLLNM